MVYSLSIENAFNPYERSTPCRKMISQKAKLARNLPLKICANIIDFIKNIVFSEDFRNRHRRLPQHFTRNRCLPFYSLVFFLIQSLRGAYQSELDRFFKILYASNVAKRVVTKAAFTKARMNLRFEAFIELNHHLGRFFEKYFHPKTWLGHRLLVMDGSTVRLPHTPGIEKHFGAWRSRKGRSSPMARISQLFDPLNKITVDALIKPKKYGERELAADHVLHLMPKDLVLLDRGYPAWWLFALILSMNGQFCARISSKWKIVRAFIASGETQRIVCLPIPTTSMKMADRLGLDPKPLKLRLIRIDTPDNTVILITSLTDSHTYPLSVFSDLYHLRWPVEEDYKAIKCRIDLENFSGKSALSVYQDFHAKVLMKNLVSLFTLPVNDTLTETLTMRQHDYQVNFTQAVSTCRDTFILLFQRSKRKAQTMIRALLDLLKKTIEPIRPGRKCSRNHRVSSRKFYLAYKPCA